MIDNVVNGISTISNVNTSNTSAHRASSSFDMQINQYRDVLSSVRNESIENEISLLKSRSESSKMNAQLIALTSEVGDSIKMYKTSTDILFSTFQKD
jgi:hypothetical protein